MTKNLRHFKPLGVAVFDPFGDQVCVHVDE